MPPVRTRIKTKEIGLPEMVCGYFLGPFFVLVMTTVISTYYLTFYRTYENVVAWGTFLTLLPLLSVIPMALSNVVVGILIGRTKTAQGKARPYILTAAPLLLVSGILVFSIPALPLGLRMAWMAVTYNLFAALASPMYGTAHYLMVSLSTRDLKQRGKLSVIANVPAVAANGLVSSILMPLVLNWIKVAPDSAGAQGRWQLVMGILSVLAFAGCIVEYYYTRERITEEETADCNSVRSLETPGEEADGVSGGASSGVRPEEGKIPTKRQLKAAASDRYWWIIMVFYALYQAGIMFKGGFVFNIYCNEFFSNTMVFGRTMNPEMIQSVLALISGIPLAAGMLFIWPLADRFGKKNMVIAGLAVSVLGSLICIGNPADFTVVLIGQTLKGISSIPGAYIMMALFADVLDHLEARFGFRVDGVSMSVYNAILTVVNGLAVAFFTFFYDNGAFAGAKAAEFFFLGFEVFAHAILIVVLLFLAVENNIEEEQKLIAERKKK